MADITMCKKKDCDMNIYCLRYTAKPSIFQSYFENGCKNKEYFWFNGNLNKIVLQKLLMEV